MDAVSRQADEDSVETPPQHLLSVDAQPLRSRSGSLPLNSKEPATGSSPLDGKVDCQNRGLSPRPWVWELAAALCSLLCLAAMITILVIMHQQPLAIWKLPISPNALLAIFSTFSKSAVLLVLAECMGQLKWTYFEHRAHPIDDFAVFDRASRGPWGALKLLLRLRWRATVSSIGSLLIMATLAMEPFTQQILSYRVGHVSVISSSNTMQIAQNYAATVDFNPVGALYQSYYTSPTDYTCNTERCTWYNYTSLEICNTCTDVIPRLEISCEEIREGYLKHKCYYTYPGGSNLTATWTSFPPEGHPYLQTLFKAEFHGNDEDSVAMVNILDIPWIGKSWSLEKFSSPVALQCKLYLCAKSTSILSVFNGTIERETSRVDDMFYHGCWRGLDGAKSVDEWMCLYSTSDTLLGENISFSEAIQIAEKALQKNSNPEVFLIDPAIFVSLTSGMEWIFNRDRTEYTFESFDPGAPESNLELSSLLYNANNGNHSRTMDKLAAALTHEMKFNNGTAIAGHIDKAEQFVHVKWPWLILPGSVIVFSIAFLGVSMLLSAERHQVVWKTSALATLFHGLEGWDVENFGSLRSESEMDEISRSLRARLRSRGDGYLSLRRSDDGV